jgi:uncharacterized protein
METRVSVERRLVRSPHPALAGLEWPVFDARGRTGGPHLTLIAGIHGGEYSSIAAVVRIMRGLDTSELRGTITAVPVVSLTSFRARSPFVVPEDGKNLNRSFPGDPEGSFAEVLAHHVVETWFRGSDAILDLHGGDMVEALEPFSLFGASSAEERARAMAIAFGLPYLLREEPSGGPGGGMTTDAAGALGIPAVIAEVGGCGLLEEEAVAWHVEGVGNVLRSLGMLPGDPLPPRRPIRQVAHFVWPRSREAGWWQPAVGPGDEIPAGGLVGTIHDLFGDEVERVTSDDAGVALFVTSSPAVAADGLLAGIGTGLRPLER